VVIGDVMDKDAQSFIAVSLPSNKPIGFMIMVHHGGGKTHIKKIGVNKDHDVVEVASSLMSVLDPDCQVGAFVEKSWSRGETLSEFYKTNNFLIKGETDYYWYYERPAFLARRAL
jgi:hypothetical protein